MKRLVASLAMIMALLGCDPGEGTYAVEGTGYTMHVSNPAVGTGTWQLKDSSGNVVGSGTWGPSGSDNIYNFSGAGTSGSVSYNADTGEWFHQANSAPSGGLPQMGTNTVTEIDG